MDNPFDVAIRFLTDLTKQPEPKNMCCTLHFVYHEADKNGFNAAIRVLEAAGKVDKRRLVSLIDGSELRHALTSGGAADPQMYVIDTEAEGQLLALLSALPDGTPEGKE
jgi:hypothetical protein